jgi:hypothetical protein
VLEISFFRRFWIFEDLADIPNRHKLVRNLTSGFIFVMKLVRNLTSGFFFRSGGIPLPTCRHGFTKRHKIVMKLANTSPNRLKMRSSWATPCFTCFTQFSHAERFGCDLGSEILFLPSFLVFSCFAKTRNRHEECAKLGEILRNRSIIVR